MDSVLQRPQHWQTVEQHQYSRQQSNLLGVAVPFFPYSGTPLSHTLEDTDITAGVGSYVDRASEVSPPELPAHKHGPGTYPVPRQWPPYESYSTHQFGLPEFFDHFTPASNNLPSPRPELYRDESSSLLSRVPLDIVPLAPVNSAPTTASESYDEGPLLLSTDSGEALTHSRSALERREGFRVRNGSPPNEGYSKEIIRPQKERLHPDHCTIETGTFGALGFPKKLESSSPRKDSPSGSIGAKTTSGSSSEHASPPANRDAVGGQVRADILHGPCSHTWDVPSPKKSRKKERRGSSFQSRASQSERRKGQKPRTAFTDEKTRRHTAWTRKLRACLRCHMQKTRCEIDTENPYGPCLTCQSLSAPTWSNLPCLRFGITDASLYREQNAPFQRFSRRWQSMDLIDINEWASDATRSLEVTQTFLHAPYTLEVKEFIPIDGDMLQEIWTDGNGIVRKHDIPPYALHDMGKTAKSIQTFVDKNIATYITGVTGNSDDLLWKTYYMAFQHSEKAAKEEERSLLQNTLRFWVACRMTSHPERICGKDRLGIGKVTDPASMWYKYLPIPPIIVAQMECIVYTRLLRPLSKAVLSQLHQLIYANKKHFWFTIYLTTFLLLHSCSMITRRDTEYARQISLSEKYANPSSIEAHHMGASTILAHFHYVNKGKHPFILALDMSNLPDLAKFGSLNQDQVEFVRETALLVQDRELKMKSARETGATGDDLYWIAQLFEQDWKP